MVQLIPAYLIAAIVFFAIDLVWILGIARGFYAANIGDLLLERPRLGAAAVFYAGYVAGIVYFAVAPALAEGSLTKALLNGALLGLIAYATYDMTNYATMKGFPLQVALADMAWGAALTAVSAGAGYLGTRMLFPA